MPSIIDKGKAPSAAGESPAVAKSIWKAFAFSSPNLPSAGSAVYYFSDGHAEQCCSRPRPGLFPSFVLPCHLTAVNLHVDSNTEQAFATFSLTNDVSSPLTTTAKIIPGGRVTSVVKTLSMSEINREDKKLLKLPERAHEVFRYSEDEVDVYDMNNRRWTFGHMVTGLIHWLTSGWYHFLSCKELEAGDSVVFVRDDDGTIFVGCRRFDGDKRDAIAMNMKASSSSSMPDRSMKKREEPETAIQTMRAIEDGEGMAEGRYYPDSKLPVYVVKKEVAENAMKIQWKIGMLVQKEWEMADGSKCLFYGTVLGLSPFAFNNPWRMLEVFWDKACKRTRENPWDVEPLRANFITKNLDFFEEEIEILD